ncbi:type VI secretion system tip protein VgrG [Orbaceae bacterium ac157xtp]
MATLQDTASALTKILPTHNRYTLQIDGLNAPLSIFSLKGDEALNNPWCYEVEFTSTSKNLEVSQLLSQPASLSFNPDVINEFVNQISSLDVPQAPRTLYGVVTEFSQLSVNKDEALYRVTLQPRLALLANYTYSAIYQNQSVIAVVEEIVRRHGFTGVDYRLELNNSYPAREIITQWQESDLAFIQRILADVGVWFRFESHAKHGCDVMVISDYEQGYEDKGTLTVKAPSGMQDKAKFSVWDLQLNSKTVEQHVIVQDYNYREAEQDRYSKVNTTLKESTTRGEDYRYGEHYKQKGDGDQIESGHWYAKIRHEQKISDQILIQGRCNDYNLAPGQHVRLLGAPIADSEEGIIILSTQSHGDRSTAFEMTFIAIPYNVLKPYRPLPIPWKTINGTVPARVTSPDNDTYGYLDPQGRYKVKFDFDLKTWRKGQESLWVRLAKPYAGNTYGFHFPLIDGTEVAIAFTDGNPDRPYIAHAMHDSVHPDHVSTANKHRNVIRTPANNKLRMDDKRGQEHIKLATEYGKTQLNLGHLVDKQKAKRGEGFELRTDEWGAIAANKGLYLTTQTEPKAQGKQLDMEGAIIQLENALSIARALHSVATSTQAHPSNIDSQEQLKSALTNLTQAGLLAYAPEGIGLTSDENIQLSSANSITTTSANNTDINALKNVTLAAEEAISVLAHKSGMKLYANQGKVEIQAQDADLNIAAKQDINIDSVDKKIDLSAAKTITLICGGSYIKISSEGIELGTTNNVTLKCSAMQKMGPAGKDAAANLPKDIHCQQKLTDQIQKQHVLLELD